MMPLRAIPLPLAIYALVLSGAAAATGLAMLAGGGYLPGWFPSGLVDADGQRAVLSPGIYRLLGIGCLFLAAAILLMVVAGSAAGGLVGFLLVAIGVIVLLVAAAVAWDERRTRSLRQTRSNRLWTVAAFGVTMAVNWGLFWYVMYGAHRQ
jgi:hypothetical protein